MTSNIPLILDAQDNRIKELPIGNNLDLTGSGIENADFLTVNGNLTVNSIIINSKTLDPVAFSGNYADLSNTPTGFSGDYNDLTNKPAVPNISRNLEDIDEQEPTDGQALIYDATSMTYKPESIINQSALDQLTLGSLSNVVTQGSIVTNKFLKFTAGAWRPSFIQYSEVQDKPTNVSFFANDAGYITADAIQEIQGDFQGSVFADDSTLLVDGVNGAVPGTLTGNWNNPDNSFIVQGEGITVATGSTNFLVSDGGINFTNSGNSENISLQVGNGGVVLSGSSSATIALGGALTAATGAISWSVNGTVTLTSEDLSWAVNGAVNLAADNINIGPGGVDADLTGSVFSDDSTLLVDGVNSTLPYVPSTAGNWQSPAPETVYEALDRLAAAVASLGTNA